MEKIFYSLCRNEQQCDPMQTIDTMDDIIGAIDLRMQQNKHERDEHVLRAQYYEKKGEREAACSELKKKNEKKVKYLKLLCVKENIERIRDKINDVTPMQYVVESMKTANNILAFALKKINNEDVESLMDDLHCHSVEIHEINNVLSDTSRFEIDDDVEKEKVTTTDPVILTNVVVMPKNKRIPIMI